MVTFSRGTALALGGGECEGPAMRGTNIIYIIGAIVVIIVVLKVLGLY